jgi:hypothetical protein
MLVFFFGMSQHTAQGTTLALMVPPVGILGAWEYYMQGGINVGAAGLICVGFILGAFVGAHFASGMSSKGLSRVFGLAMLVIALKMLLVG